MAASGTDEGECVDCRDDVEASAQNGSSSAAPVEDLMDPSTFIHPLTAQTAGGLPGPCVIIEYCQRCKFGLRVNWVQQEVLSTFAASLASVLVIPKSDEASAGRFRVYYTAGQSSSSPAPLQLVWDRKTQAGFPEMKVLKQRLRDLVQPDQNLGHSDKS